MERLTERNPLWIDEFWESACEPNCEEVDAVYRRSKAYGDAEEQGVALAIAVQSRKCCILRIAVVIIHGALILMHQNSQHLGRDNLVSP